MFNLVKFKYIYTLDDKSINKSEKANQSSNIFLVNKVNNTLNE